MNDFYISTKRSHLDKQKIWLLLKNCFWCKNIPIDYVERFINYSLCFGVYNTTNDQLIGFGRVISDYTTYAYMCDIVIDPQFRKQGIGQSLINTILSHPDLQGIKTWSLRTSSEAKNIYLKNGFKIADCPETQLEINDLNIYLKPNFINLHKKAYLLSTSEVTQ